MPDVFPPGWDEVEHPLPSARFILLHKLSVIRDFLGSWSLVADRLGVWFSTLEYWRLGNIWPQRSNQINIDKLYLAAHTHRLLNRRRNKRYNDKRADIAAQKDVEQQTSVDETAPPVV